tara:strand:- start:446 stop:628 length:183 start_codon:yes stop_codon:yes gene_type:complete
MKLKEHIENINEFAKNNLDALELDIVGEDYEERTGKIETLLDPDLKWADDGKYIKLFWHR